MDCTPAMKSLSDSACVTAWQHQHSFDSNLTARDSIDKQQQQHGQWAGMYQQHQQQHDSTGSSTDRTVALVAPLRQMQLNRCH